VESHTVTAPSSGVVQRLDAYAVGVAAWRLGAGRARKEDPVSAGAGVVMAAKVGDPVTEGGPLFVLHADTEDRFERALEALEGACAIGPSATRAVPLVIDRIGG
ncbi:MAG: thymidine phosphorylase, partial [Pseudonocardiales bacterium]